MTGRFDTFANWKAAGYRIKKGSTSYKRDEHGVALFHSDQVRVPMRGSIMAGGNSDHGSGDWDEDPGYSDLGIEAFQ